jgi:apolipoprotein N-acyltransferase
MPLQEEPLRYENKYVFIRGDGTIDHTYFKHEPVPGEPAVRGEGPMPVVQDEDGKVGGAICYDYDFPRVALGNARNDVDLVALPSSDWRGIDPIHTQMAAIRAIEGGTSIIRSTRFGLSAGIDPWGRIRGWSSHFDGRERVLLVRLPRRGVTTVYEVLGDWFPATCLLLSIGLLVVAIRRPR